MSKPLFPFRDTTVVGWPRGGHEPACNCEACGPVVLLALSDYEATRLQNALERRQGEDTGDWHGQLRYKLARALGEWKP